MPAARAAALRGWPTSSQRCTSSRGEPFTDLPQDGWSWLLEGDRLDDIMTAAIVDVGHIVTTHGLATGDLELADFASNVALAASPYDEVANLDRVAVDRAMGNDATPTLCCATESRIGATTARDRSSCPANHGRDRREPLGRRTSTPHGLNSAPGGQAEGDSSTCGSRHGTSKASGPHGTTS